MPDRRRLLIAGAAGRDFHNFNVVYRERPDVEVVAFTAAQIPDIGGRVYPPELAGPLYPEGIPILDEADLEKAIAEERNAALEGRVFEVLVEGPSERDESVLFGRTRAGKATVFEGEPCLAGTVARVAVTSSTARTLRGNLVE